MQKTHKKADHHQDNHELKHLLHQAKSEARKDSLKKFYAKNSKIFMIAMASAVFALLVFFAFDAYNKSQQEKFSEIFHQSLIDQQVGDIEKAKKNLKKIYETKSAPNGIRSLASLRYAAFLLDEKKKTEAAEIYENISYCSGCDPYIRDLSRLLLVRVLASNGSEIKQENLIARIEKIEAKSRILRYYISEQKGLIEIQQNNLEKAYATFQEILENPESQKNLKARAADALKLITSKGFEPKVAVSDSKKETKKSDKK